MEAVKLFMGTQGSQIWKLFAFIGRAILEYKLLKADISVLSSV